MVRPRITGGSKKFSSDFIVPMTMPRGMAINIAMAKPTPTRRSVAPISERKLPEVTIDPTSKRVSEGRGTSEAEKKNVMSHQTISIARMEPTRKATVLAASQVGPTWVRDGSATASPPMTPASALATRVFSSRTITGSNAIESDFACQ